MALREVESNKNCKATAVAAISTGNRPRFGRDYLIRVQVTYRITCRCIDAMVQPEVLRSSNTAHLLVESPAQYRLASLKLPASLSSAAMSV